MMTTFEVGPAIAPAAERARESKREWTIRVWPNSTEATMTYHVDTWEDVKRVVATQIMGYTVRKVDIQGP